MPSQALLRQLKALYNNVEDPGSLGGVQKFYERARALGIKVSRKHVEEFLKTQDTYTLHKPARRNIHRAKTIVGGIDQQWQADLADMTQIGRANKGFRYILTVIDCFSKFAWAIPVKTKDGPTIKEAFVQLFSQSQHRIPKRLQTDKGKEFFNKDVENYLKTMGVKLFATESEKKAAIVERFNRTLKTKLWAYFSAYNTDQYLDVLPKILSAYNNSKHRTIGMKPKDVKKTDEKKLFARMFGMAVARGPGSKTLVKDDTVRISKSKALFEKGYLPNWTGELFRVSDKVYKPGRKMYQLKDWSGEKVAGAFYPEEVQAVTKNDEDVYIIEKVIKSRTLKDGSKQQFVKWRNWPDKFNSWVDGAEVINLKDPI